MAIDGDSQPQLRADMRSAAINKEYFDHLKKVNDIFYDQIKISDQKAAYIFTFMLAFLLSSNEGRSVFSLSRYKVADVLPALSSGVLALASVFSVICAILVILPRRAEKTTTLFWGTWPQHRDAFHAAAQATDMDYLFRQYLDNVDVLATIARDKYRCVKLGFRGLVVTVIAYVCLLIVS